MPRQIFRQEALERLSSPEQLDRLMQVTSPRAWIALLGVGVLLSAGVLWSFYGTLPVTVTAHGVLLRQGFQPLAAPQAGVVTDIQGRAGEPVKKGQVLVLLTAANGGKQLEVVSPFPARVLGRRVRKGDRVEKGAPLLLLEPLDQPLRARLFIPGSDGYQVRPGMDVQVWPTQVRQGEFGYLVGKVRFASIFPLSHEEMLRIVQNDELVQQLSRAGPCLQVVVELTPDEGTASGYRWSSSGGAPVQLYSGMPCEARVIVNKRRPIELVFPGLAGTRGP